MMKTKQFVLGLSLVIITTSFSSFTFGDSYKKHKNYNRIKIQNFNLTGQNHGNKKTDKITINEDSEYRVRLSGDILNTGNNRFGVIEQDITKNRYTKKNEELYGILTDEEIEKFKHLMKAFRENEHQFLQKLKSAKNEEEKNTIITESQTMREKYKNLFSENFGNLMEMNLEYGKRNNYEIK